MAGQDVDLVKLFNSATKALKAEKASLNEADTYNHDHGDNMVKNFRLITKALKEKQGATPSEQLSYASQVLKTKSASGSAAMYSKGLAQAATQLMGQQSVNPSSAANMIQALIGSQIPAQEEKAQADKPSSSGGLGDALGSLMGGGGASGGGGMGDLLGSLLGGGGGGGEETSTASAGGGMGGLLGSLLGGGGSSSGGSGGLGGLVGSLLGGGGGGLGSLVGSLVGNSQVNDSVHHNQSGQLVVGALLGALGKMMAKK